MDDLAKEGKRLAEELRRAYARPFRPLKRGLQRILIRFVLLFRGLLPAKRAEKLARSLNKRRPRAYTDGWKRKVARIRSDRATAAAALPVRRDTVQKWPPDPKKAGKVLVADQRIPRPDAAAGDRATAGILRDLKAVGFDVTFLPADLNDLPEYRAALEEDGIRVVTARDGFSHPTDFVREKGSEFGLFYLFRVEVAEALTQVARDASPDARVIFHAPDLHFLRERRAERFGSGRSDSRSDVMRTREMTMMQAADLTVLVSPAEVPFVREFLPAEKIAVFPVLYSPVAAAPASFGDRRNLFFLGAYKHRPNVDAVRWFVDEVWPLVRKELPDAEFHIIGADAPDSVVDLGKRPGVKYVGFVTDLDDALNTYRVSVAPLRFGAGIKGKLGAAMGAGAPSVCTSIAAEGMAIADGVHALVRDDAVSFARAVVSLYEDEALWTRVAAQGHSLAERAFGNAANRSGLLRVLDAAKALSLEKYVELCREIDPVPMGAEGADGGVGLTVIVSAGSDDATTRMQMNALGLALRGTLIDHEVLLVLPDGAEGAEALVATYRAPRVIRVSSSKCDTARLAAALAAARGRLVLYLGASVLPLPQLASELVASMEAVPDLAIGVPATLDSAGFLVEVGRDFSSEGSAWLLGAGRPITERFHGVSREVQGSGGRCVLLRRDLIPAEGLDCAYADMAWTFSDLAMKARSLGQRAVTVPAARVIDLGLPPAATSFDAGDEARFRERWGEILRAGHPPPETEPEVAAALAETTVPADARTRRSEGRLNVLYFSPFPSHPDSHGNQATIQSFGRRFKALGHRVHFALLESGMYDQGAIAAMQSAWDSFDILPNTRRLWSDGSAIPFDGWYDAGLGENVRVLCSRYNIDVVFCSYVFQSKLLEFVPAHMLKVIDTHDKMGDRYEMLRRNGQPLEFFSCTPEEEGRYLRRADVVVARRAEEAEYFDSVTGRKSAIVIPHVEEARLVSRTFGPVRNVGLVASANRINLAITLDFLKELARREGGGTFPFTLHIAGQVSGMIGRLSKEDAAYFSRPWVKLLGFVPDIGEFYRSVDLVVSPVTMGTGINVKTVQAMAYGMPLVTTAWGSKGIETGHPMHGYQDLESLVDGVFRLRDDPASVEALAAVSRERYARFLAESDGAIEALFKEVNLGDAGMLRMKRKEFK